MAAKRRWLWVILFVWLVLLLAILAAGWNVVLVQDYRQFMELAHLLSRPGEASALSISARPPWASIVLGTLGFLAAVGIMAGFFVRLLGEMRLNQLQAEFLAAVSHELKTPLASLQLTSTLLREKTSDPTEESRLWESHDAELKRLKEEVETLLEAARWRARPTKVERFPIELEEWLADGMTRWRRILGPDARLVREGDPLPGKALLDERTLWLITDNLVDNARKFSRGKPVIVVRTQWRTGRWGRGHWSIDFEDQGWGFNPKDSRRIFTPFYRAKSSAPHAIPGNGLGLYLAASACRALGLKLKGRSGGVAKGATFTIEGQARTLRAVASEVSHAT